MTSEKSETSKNEGGKMIPVIRDRLDHIFEGFRDDIENLIATSWRPHSWEWKLPLTVTTYNTRVPL